MKNLWLLLRIIAIFVLTFFLLLNLGVGQARAGNFAATCDKLSLEGTTMSAVCEKANGYDFNKTSINLTNFISNLDGNLSWGGDSFALSCSSAELSKNPFTKASVEILNAECEDKAGNPVPTSIDLSERISNIDGVLQYDR